MMSTLVFIINDLLSRNKSSWYGFFILFVLVFSIRLLPVFTTDTGLIYVADLSSRFLWLMVFIFLMVLFINYLVLDTHKLKYEVMFYKALGTGLISQFFTKLAVLLVYCFILISLFWIMLWSIDVKYTLLMFVFCAFMLMMRLIALYIKNVWIYYSGLLMAIVSIFYPVYIYPNTAYVLKAPLYDAMIYILLYFVLYILLSLKFYLSSWRKECIGLNY